jgi:hypothetical protein
MATTRPSAPAPTGFVADGTGDDQMPNMWDFIDEPAQDEPRYHRPTPPIPDDEAVEAIADFNLNLANLRATSVKKGQRFRRDDPLVKKHPEFFQVPARPLGVTK